MSPAQPSTTIDKLQVRRHFSCHAGEYNRYAKIQQRVVERLVALLEEQPRTLTAGLEVGSGTGLLASRFKKTFPAAELIISDLAHGMSCQSQMVLPDCPVCDADAAALPFCDNSFDYLISSSVYQWVEDLPGAFAEVDRVLRPGGLFALALFGERTLHELKTSHRNALSGRPSHGQNFPSLNSVEQALPGRFAIEKLFSEDEIEWHADVQELLRNLKRIGAQNSSNERPAGMASRRTMQAMFDFYRSEFGDRRGIPATYQVIYLLVRKLEGTYTG